MSEESDTILSLQDVLEEDQELESTANAVLGGSDDAKCSYSKGYVSRQALYACGTCTNETSMLPAGVCLACSLHCHEGHELYELYTKRLFRCDCGNKKFPGFVCTLNPDKDPLNSDNKYNHNFRGLYCTCNRPYPDDEDEVEDEMIQCVVCEDWFHSRHLENDVPPSYEEMACDSCMKSHDFLHLYQLHTTPTKVETENQSTSDASLEVANAPESSIGTETNGVNSSSGIGDEATANGRNTCELVRRKALESYSVPSGSKDGAGFFDKKWRSQLCKCSACEDMYKSSDCMFLLDESDSLAAYEELAGATTYPSTHDAAVAALGTIDHVHQVEAIHHFSELKTELSGFLNDFAQKKKVVSKKDIEDFFEVMQNRKRKRLETGEGVPPAKCHF